MAFAHGYAEAPQLLAGGEPVLVGQVVADEHRHGPAERRVALTGGVVIVDESTGTRVEFHSPDLLVDAVRRTASTASSVRVSSAHGDLRGSGLFADMNAGTIRLESSVRGRYAP